MAKNTNKKPVQLPKGHMCRDCCGDCRKVNPRDKTSEGKIWCGEFAKYVWGSDPACSYFTRG